MDKVFIFPNFKKSNVADTLPQLFKFFQAHGYQIVLPDACANQYGALQFSQEKLSGFIGVKLAISLGGDGTLLNMVKEIAPFNIPICGINMGQVGFLADLRPNSLSIALDKIIQGQYTIEKRKMLKVEVFDNQTKLYGAHALNDIVLTRNHNSQMLRIYVQFSDDSNIKYPVDGLIFSTPTGSTAYSLSAGGPIIHPSLDATLITPICPYAMYTKPLATSTEEIIKVTFAPNSGTGTISVDGMDIGNLEQSYMLKITTSEHTTSFIRISEPHYYPTWQERLRRGEESANF